MRRDLVLTAARRRLAAFHSHARKAFFANKRTSRDLVTVIRQRRAVIRLLRAVRRQYDLHRIDRQGAGGVGDIIIGRNAGDGSLFRFRQVVLRAFGDVGDGGSRAEGSGDLRRIGAQLSANRVLTIQGRAIVGLGGLGGSDGQGEGVVDDDYVAILGDSDRLGRVVAVNRQILLLIGRYGRCGILRPDGLLGGHVIGHRGGGVLQVVMDSDRGLVQLEVGIVGMHFIDAVIVLGGREVSISTDGLSSFVHCPVVDDVGVGAGHGGGAIGRTRGSLDRFRSQGDRAHAGAIGSDGIVDGHIVLFPNRVDILIRNLFVCGNMCGFFAERAVGVILSVIIPDELLAGCGCCGDLIQRNRIVLPVERRGDTLPALEGKSCAGRSSGDLYCLVDLERSVCSRSILAEGSAAVILEPVNVRGLGLEDGLIDRAQLDGIGCFVYNDDLVALIVQYVLFLAFTIDSGLVMPRRIVACVSRTDDAARVLLKDGELRAGLYGHA